MPRTEKRQSERLAGGMTALLADTYAVYHSTQVCHWNVEGPMFRALHELFEQQYREQADAIDTIAERVRCLGFYAPATLAQMVKLTRIQQPDRLPGNAQAMLDHLIEAHAQIVHRINEVRTMAEEVLDEATADLLVERLRVHEEALWMLRSQAGRDSAELVTPTRLTKAS